MNHKGLCDGGKDFDDGRGEWDSLAGVKRSEIEIERVAKSCLGVGEANFHRRTRGATGDSVIIIRQLYMCTAHPVLIHFP